MMPHGDLVGIPLDIEMSLDLAGKRVPAGSKSCLPSGVQPLCHPDQIVSDKEVHREVVWNPASVVLMLLLIIPYGASIFCGEGRQHQLAFRTNIGVQDHTFI